MLGPVVVTAPVVGSIAATVGLLDSHLIAALGTAAFWLSTTSPTTLKVSPTLTELGAKILMSRGLRDWLRSSPMMTIPATAAAPISRGSLAPFRCGDMSINGENLRAARAYGLVGASKDSMN